MPFFTTTIPVIENAMMDKTAPFQASLNTHSNKTDYTLLVDTERMQQALDSGFVKMPNHIQGKSQIHEFLNVGCGFSPVL